MNVISNIKDVFDIEINELNKIKNKINCEVERAINIIFDSAGKIVITGVGKSGHIGRKIASTLASTGTLSIFMHSTEALHGDLGMVKQDDIIIGISNSGNSEELISILPSIKKIGCKIIAITGNKKSKLAENADVVIDIGVDKEACPMNLAPTCSTTAALVLGDAIAATLVKIKDFKPENFALYHPGGALGKRLLLKVEDLMQPLENIAICSSTTKMDKVLLEMTEKNLGAVCITENSKIIGIITEGDIRRALLKKEIFFDLTSKDIMTSEFSKIEKNSLAIDALEMMENFNKKIYQLPVIDNNYNLVGLIRLHDLFSIKK